MRSITVIQITKEEYKKIKTLTLDGINNFANKNFSEMLRFNIKIDSELLYDDVAEGALERGYGIWLVIYSALTESKTPPCPDDSEISCYRFMTHEEFNLEAAKRKAPSTLHTFIEAVGW